jgi:glycerophosphoryl diester phosphodiesterase
MKLKPWHKVVIFLFAIIVFLRLIAKPAPEQAYYSSDMNYPLVIAHQGGDGLWPGDTLFAYQNAVKLGVDVLEMDIHITKDGVLVLMHDEAVDRTTNGIGEIESMTLAELKQLDAGYDWSPDEGKTFPFRGKGVTVTALEELFQTFPDKHMTIEIKKSNASMIKPFCDLIRQYNMQDKILVASFYDDKIKEFRTECPEVATSSAKTETTIFVLLSKAFLTGFYSPKFLSLQVPEESGGITVMTKSFVNASHARGLAVEVWTINDTDTMQKLINWGVDGLITDRPDLMLKLLGR